MKIQVPNAEAARIRKKPGHGEPGFCRCSGTGVCQGRGKGEPRRSPKRLSDKPVPIAKKEAQRREPTGLLAPGGADAGKAGPRWSQNTDRSTAFPHGPATWLISQSRFGHASPPRIVSVARRWCALGCCHGGLIGHARSPRSRRRALAWSRSSWVSGCSTPIASNCLCGGGWYGRGRWF
jgi:hypothetical protein